MKFENFALNTNVNGIAFLVWDMPGRGFNVLTRATVAELTTIVEIIGTDPGIIGVVLASGKKSFSTGCDLLELRTKLMQINTRGAAAPDLDDDALQADIKALSRLFRRIETNSKPWVAVVDGFCIGAAFGLALACHGRVADNSATIAFPEASIGLFPAGVTQRLLRLVRPEVAFDLLISGRELSAQAAKMLKLVDEITVEKDEAIRMATEMLTGGLKASAPWDDPNFIAPCGQIDTATWLEWPPAAAILARKPYDNYPAPRAILQAAYEGLQEPFDAAEEIERHHTHAVLKTPQAAAMLKSLYFSRRELGRGARRPSHVPMTKFTKIGVIGAGFMGAGIAYVTAKAGIPVVLLDRDLASAQKGWAYSERLISNAVDKDTATLAHRTALLARIAPTADYSDLHDCDLVIEAVFEDSAVKKIATQQAEAVLAPTAILASNTSTIPISFLAKNSSRPTSFIGIHFFSPVDRMSLVEVILGDETSDAALATALDYVRAIDKTPIVVNDTRGFYVNRCVGAYMAEAYNMLIEGVPGELIEDAAKAAGMPVGPLALNDETALDLSLKIMKQTIRDLGEGSIQPKHLSLVSTLVEEHGRMGRKNGKGFYDYPDKPAKKTLWPGVNGLYPQQAIAAIDFDELKRRILFVIALEAVRVLQEGILTDPREADVGSILAIGFAPFTGGVLSMIGEIGLVEFVRLATQLQLKYGSQFEPPELLLEMAKDGRAFYDHSNCGRLDQS